MKRLKTTLPKYLSKTKTDGTHNKIADDLIAAENPVIIFGEHINSNPLFFKYCSPYF